ncbi:MAG: ABC transporter permease subunit [Methanobacteriota archaeon]|nr:MAG: ABC transporter permease subunit [Euryarchaeota archaeon]
MTIAFLLAATARFVVTTADLLQITRLSLLVSGTSTVLATLIAVPLGALLGLHELGSARLLRNILFTLYGLPPVLAGLLVFLALSRGGPLGGLGLLYTPLGMVIAQVVIVTPIILGITTSVVSTVERRVKETATVLGADRYQLSVTVLREAAAGVLTAVMVGFGRAISEVGAVFIVGGHIEGQTQVLTTTIITDVSQAEYTHAVALGVILLVIAGVIYSLLYRLQERTLP